MNKLLIFSFIGFFILIMPNVQAQSKSPFQVEVVDNLYLRGLAQVSSEGAKKVRVAFSPEIVKVLIPHKDQSIVLEILNTDCEAYCPKVKRVRQLNPGDEQLLRNIINKQKDQIFRQLKASGVNLQSE